MAVATKVVITRKSPGVTEPLPSMQKVHTVFSLQQAAMRAIDCLQLIAAQALLMVLCLAVCLVLGPVHMQCSCLAQA